MTFFDWAESTAIGTTIRESDWLFAVLESTHLLALGVLAGAIMVVDMRLLNFGFKHQAVAATADDARPWFVGAVAAALLTGIPMFMSEAVRLSDSPPFWWKMILLGTVLLFTFTVRRRLISVREIEKTLPGKLTALLSISLWIGIVFSGKWIGYY